MTTRGDQTALRPHALLAGETQGFATDTWLTDNGACHTGDLRVVERLRRMGDTIDYEATAHDAAVLAEPWRARAQGLWRVASALEASVDTYRIMQSPGYVAIEYAMIQGAHRYARRLEAQRIASNLDLYLGDARGRFEGETLVVKTSEIGPAAFETPLKRGPRRNRSSTPATRATGGSRTSRALDTDHERQGQ